MSYRERMGSPVQYAGYKANKKSSSPKSAHYNLCLWEWTNVHLRRLECLKNYDVPT